MKGLSEIDGYSAYSTGWFNVSSEPQVLKFLKLMCHTKDSNKEFNTKFFSQRHNIDVVEYELRKLPNHYKKNKYDSARLLIVKTTNGKHLAKRYNFNEKFKMELHDGEKI